MLEPRRPWWRERLDQEGRARILPLLVALVAVNLILQAAPLSRGVRIAVLAVGLVLVVATWVAFVRWLRGRRPGG